MKDEVHLEGDLVHHTRQSNADMKVVEAYLRKNSLSETQKNSRIRQERVRSAPYRSRMI